MRSLLADLSAQPHEEETLHPLLRRREPRNVEIVHITPDRGLTGGLNANINRTASQFILGLERNVSVIAMGKKGRDFMVRYGRNVRAVFTDIGDRPVLTDVTPAARLVIEAYAQEDVDAVYVVYGQFVSTTMQRPVVEPLLPVVPAELETQQAVGYIYEPDSLTVLSELLPRFVEMQLYHTVLEGIASEQSARMVAMQNATDNANEMIDDLTLEMNKARQDMITGELLDLVGGAAAIEA
jgi:F-type H+-transporting ATPase subunit gamma